MADDAWTALVENIEDPMDRRDRGGEMQLERHGSSTSDAYDYEDLEMWRRVLLASIQLPPHLIEGLAGRSLSARELLREVCRGTREDPSRLLSSHQQSQSASSPRVLGPPRAGPSLGSK